MDKEKVYQEIAVFRKMTETALGKALLESCDVEAVFDIGVISACYDTSAQVLKGTIEPGVIRSLADMCFERATELYGKQNIECTYWLGKGTAYKKSLEAMGIEYTGTVYAA